MGNCVGVFDVDGAIGGDGSEKGSDDSVGLIRSPDVAVADVEEDEGVNLGAHARRRWVELKHRLLLVRRHRSLSPKLTKRRRRKMALEFGGRRSGSRNARRCCGF